MNSHPSSAIENGFTAQLTMSVTPMPRQWRADFPSAAKSIFISIGDDHQPDQRRDRHIDLGDLHRADRVEHAGKKWPSATPATMQSATQSER